VQTQYLEQESKTIVNKVESPDVGMMYSMNPMQVVSMVVFIAMQEMYMNTGAIAPGLILKERSLSKRMRQNCCENFNASEMGCNADHVKW
jgi:hypothetical protein